MKLTKWGDALGMSWLNMQGAIKTLGYHIVSFAEDTLKSLFDGVEKAVDWFMDFDASVGGAASSTLVLVGAISLILSPLAFFGLFLFSVGQMLIKTIEFLSGAKIATMGLTGTLGFLAKAAAIVGAAFFAIWGVTEHINHNFKTGTKNVDMLSAALGVLNWVLSLAIVLGMGFVGGLLTIGDTIGTLIRIIARGAMIQAQAFAALAETVMSAFQAMIAVALDFWDALHGVNANRAGRAMKNFGSNLAKIGSLVAESMNMVNEEFEASAERLSWMTEEGSAWGDTMKQALSTLSGGALYPGIQQQIATTTPQTGATTGVPGGIPIPEAAIFPQDLKDYLDEGINLSVEVNNVVETDAAGNISVRSEVLSADEKSSTTLNQLGVRA